MDLIREIGQEPVFINQEGFSWYLAKNETRYAQTTQLRVGGEDLPALKRYYCVCCLYDQR